VCKTSFINSLFPRVGFITVLRRCEHIRVALEISFFGLQLLIIFILLFGVRRDENRLPFDFADQPMD